MNFVDELKEEYDAITDYLRLHRNNKSNGILTLVERRFEIVRELRDRTGKSYKELGELLGISHQRVYQLLTGNERKQR